jgi:hypothetical protein
MPSVLPPYRGWRIVIYPNDHRPPRVHVIGADSHARFELLCDLGQVRLMDQVGLSYRQAQSIAAYLTRHLAHLCQIWGELHVR